MKTKNLTAADLVEVVEYPDYLLSAGYYSWFDYVGVTGVDWLPMPDSVVTMHDAWGDYSSCLVCRSCGHCLSHGDCSCD